MKYFTALVLGTLLGIGYPPLSAADANNPSAFEAFASLPPEVKLNLAAVTGCEGKPTPDRWHFLVWDQTAENGFREYVVAGGQLNSANVVSQFADRMAQQDIIPTGAVRVDSDKVAWLALQYAKANNLKVASMNYELRRAPTDQIPVWKVECYDALDHQIGTVSIAADQGNVVARLGLPNEPASAASVKKPADTQPKHRPPSSDDNPSEVRIARPSPPRNASQDNGAPDSVAADQDSRDSRDRRERTDPVPVRRAEPVQRAPRPSGIGRIVRSILPF